jgi:hypothetical protein
MIALRLRGVRSGPPCRPAALAVVGAMVTASSLSVAADSVTAGEAAAENGTDP